MVCEHGAKPSAGVRIGSGGDGRVGADYAVAGEIEELDAIPGLGIVDLTVEIDGFGEGGVNLEEGAVEEGVKGSDGGGGAGQESGAGVWVRGVCAEIGRLWVVWGKMDG